MFSDILKKMRAKSHISQAKLADAIGVSPGNVSTWESGESKPSYTALYALAQFFDVSADYLLELTPQKMGIPGAPEEAPCLLDNIKEDQGLLCDGSPLEGEEADLIAMYRLLPEEEREDVFDIVHLKYKRRVERKKESIYWTYKADRLKQKSTAALDGGSQGVIA